MKNLLLCIGALMSSVMPLCSGSPLENALEKLAQCEKLSVTQIREQSDEITAARSLIAAWLKSNREDASVEITHKVLTSLKIFNEMYKKKLTGSFEQGVQQKNSQGQQISAKTYAQVHHHNQGQVMQPAHHQALVLRSRNEGVMYKGTQHHVSGIKSLDLGVSHVKNAPVKAPEGEVFRSSILRRHGRMLRMVSR